MDRSPFTDDERPRPVYEQIRDAMLSGELEPGAKLVELSIATRYGVSRTPVREALSRLEQDGLVERGPRGLIVRHRSPEEILDIYETRIVLEGTVARVAAERYTTVDAIRLEALLRACEQADPGESDEVVARNRQFHEGVWRASHNETLIDLLSRLNMHLMRYPATTLSHPGRWKNALDQHRAIVAAILARDGTTAETLGRQHFAEARDIRLALWEQGLSE